MAEDLGEKTELPSSRKLNQARLRGQIPKSVDFSGAVDLIAGVVLVWYFGRDLVDQLGAITRDILSGAAPGTGINPGGLEALLWWTGARAVVAAGPIMAIMFAAVYLSHFLQVGWLWTLQPLEPKFERLNPIKGVGRLVSKRNLIKTIMSVIKLVLIVVVVGLFVRAHVNEFAALPMAELFKGAEHAMALTIEMAAWMLLLMLMIGLADYAYQRWQHTQDLKMTKVEVKDERRSMEGDEETKARRLRMARQRLLQQISGTVPKADVVVTNPTHFAVALRYDADKMAAPVVVAKGADMMAFRIRDVARQAGVPVIEKPALARALYAQAEVGRPIRPEFFEAVAEILAYVYRLNQKAA